MNAEVVQQQPGLAAGDPAALGARLTSEGVLFSVFSDAATALELCLFDDSGTQTQKYFFEHCSDGVWHGFVPGLSAGAQYGFRAHGPFAPEQGHYFNPARLLLDPYGQGLAGQYRVSDLNQASSTEDNAAWVPRSVVVKPLVDRFASVSIAPGRRVIYEAHARGLTALDNSLPEELRGRFAGAGMPEVIGRLRALGVTSLQLLPVHAHIDEPHLAASGLSNYWGYNTLNFFTPHAPYAGASHNADLVRAEFRDMVRALHDANIEVLLDVVYNHTAEGGPDGPSLCYRGLANNTYYRHDENHDFAYINDTGCGNTLDTTNPVVRRLIVDSLRLWASDFEVDGFRFDLAVSLAREKTGFSAAHPLLKEISADPVLSGKTLIAEPWDTGPGGYQTGGFPAPWYEWNDRFRDALRSYWRNDAGAQAELGRRLHGSSDLFENNGRSPLASINLITAHDGFTLADLVAYNDKHNLANGEDNRDGHNHNLSDNLGVEGVTKEPGVLRARGRRERALLATLFLAQGTPMLLAGDECRNSQGGNNNAYCQDNDIGWVQWDQRDLAHEKLVRRLIELRGEYELFSSPHFNHDELNLAQPDHSNPSEWRLRWQRFDGERMGESDWLPDAAAGALPFSLVWANDQSIVLIALNPAAEAQTLNLPAQYSWRHRLDSSQRSGMPAILSLRGCRTTVAAQSLNFYVASRTPVCLENA